MPTERVQRRIDALLDQVDQAVDALEGARVRELCDGVLRLDPANEDALSFLDAAGRETGIALEPEVDAPPPETTSSQASATTPTEMLPPSPTVATRSNLSSVQAVKRRSTWPTTPLLIET